MKRWTLTLLLTFFFLLAIPSPAQAASPEAMEAAEALHALNLFRGTGVSPDGTPIYDLDQTPTRNQAVIMLVRLLGKEEEALSGTWTLPFRDVPSGSTAAPYIGWAYEQGLTKGTTETSYGGAMPITRNQYLLFLMRVLGYAYDELRYGQEGMNTEMAAQAALYLGLTDGTEPEAFTRGDVALLSLRALDTWMCWMKPNLVTLRESLELGPSPKLKDRSVPVQVTAYESYEEADAQVQRGEDSVSVRQELPLPKGTLVSFAYVGTPHGTSEMLWAVLQDGRVLRLPLPELNGWGVRAAPQNLAWNETEGTVTYEAAIPEDLPWNLSICRKAGTYRFTCRLSDGAAWVSML